jgi:pyruvate,water dikinase
VQTEKKIIALLREMAGRASRPEPGNATQQSEKAEAFIAAFSSEDTEYARQLIAVAQKSYRLRDDDNIYLGKVEANLSMAMQVSRRRLGIRCGKQGACLNPEEVITALKFPEYMPQAKEETFAKQETIHIQARQLRGQPAGKGIARGKARVARSHDDLFDIQKDEILVCDAIDPTMTFIIPMVSAIVERRGGMLIHGAIIAREYGIPCVTGIPQATEFIQTGDSLTVDGYYGLVTNHSRTLEP